jgi:hypothetical protein
METDRIPELEHLELHVLEEYDEEHETFVARCLETGTVSTANEMDSLREIMRETLQLEITLAARSGNFANLWKRPAPGDVWARWHYAAGSGGKDESTMTISISLGTIPKREVKSEIRITKASISRTA